MTYNASFACGSHLVENPGPPGGPYLAIGEELDSEVTIRSFVEQESPGVFPAPHCSHGLRIQNPTPAYRSAAPPER